MSRSPGEVTVLLHRWREGDETARDEVFSLVYETLRRLAGAKIRHESPGHSVQVSDLVQETYLRLADQTRCEWQDRKHFLLIAATVMRRLLIDHARARQALRRGGKASPLPLDSGIEVALPAGLDPDRVLDIHEAMSSLRELDPIRGEIAELRVYLQMTVEEVADALRIPEGTVKRKWSSSRLWLHQQLAG
ncbi:MAG: ECF-type sigma factor [Acidobacteriota bacterium]